MKLTSSVCLASVCMRGTRLWNWVIGVLWWLAGWLTDDEQRICVKIYVFFPRWYIHHWKTRRRRKKHHTTKQRWQDNGTGADECVRVYAEPIYCCFKMLSHAFLRLQASIVYTHARAHILTIVNKIKWNN